MARLTTHTPLAQHRRDDILALHGMGPKALGIGNDIKFAMAKASYNFRNSIKQWMSEILHILYEAAALCINTIRTFYLIVLAILGPLIIRSMEEDGYSRSFAAGLVCTGAALRARALAQVLAVVVRVHPVERVRAAVARGEAVAPADERLPGLGADHVVEVDLVEEAAADAGLLLAEAVAAAREREEEDLLGAGHADVEEPPACLERRYEQIDRFLDVGYLFAHRNGYLVILGVDDVEDLPYGSSVDVHRPRIPLLGGEARDFGEEGPVGGGSHRINQIW